MEKKTRKFWEWIKNKYIIVCIIFLIWMIFFDMNSLLVHQKLNSDLSEVNEKIDLYTQKYKEDSVQYFRLKTSSQEREKFARERYYMKKNDEDIFIIVHKKDSLQ